MPGTVPQGSMLGATGASRGGSGGLIKSDPAAHSASLVRVGRSTNGTAVAAVSGHTPLGPPCAPVAVEERIPQCDEGRIKKVQGRFGYERQGSRLNWAGAFRVRTRLADGWISPQNSVGVRNGFTGLAVPDQSSSLPIDQSSWGVAVRTRDGTKSISTSTGDIHGDCRRRRLSPRGRDLMWFAAVGTSDHSKLDGRC